VDMAASDSTASAEASASGSWQLGSTRLELLGSSLAVQEAAIHGLRLEEQGIGNYLRLEHQAPRHGLLPEGGCQGCHGREVGVCAGPEPGQGGAQSLKRGLCEQAGWRALPWPG